MKIAQFNVCGTFAIFSIKISEQTHFCHNLYKKKSLELLFKKRMCTLHSGEIADVQILTIEEKP